MCQDMSQPNKTSNDLSQIRNSQDLRANLQNISNILNTNLSPETLEICIQLCEAGVHPQALANVIQQIRSEMAHVQSGNSSSSSTQNGNSHR
jgi:mitotic-spindle organizing protein 1